MKKFTAIAAAMTMVGLVGSSHAAELVLDRAGNTGITLIEDGIASRSPVLRFKAHVSSLTANEVKTDKGAFTELQIAGGQHEGANGAPAIPVLTKLVEVPFGAKLTVRVADRTVSTVTLSEKLGMKAPLMPRQPPHPKDGTVVPFAFDAQSYQAPGFQQGELVKVEEVGVMRDRRLAMVTVAPVAYEPATGKIEIFEDVSVEMGLEGADLAKTAQIKQKYASRYFDWAARETVVPATLKGLVPTTEHAQSLLIVADRMFEAELKRFVEWKTQKGFHVTVSYTDQIGNTTEKIKANIQNAFSNATAEAPAPDFVLFVGDNEQIPAFQGTAGSHITDLPYVCVAGNDTIPDILTGRFSARKPEELKPQIDKTLYYEKAQFADASFLKNVVLVAGWDYSHAIEWGWPQIKYGLKYFFNAAHGLTGVTSFLSSTSNDHTRDIIDRVSAGCCFLNYTAHGSPESWADPGFEMNDIDGLQNDGKYPLVVGNCCLTNSFQVGECFGEHWLRVANKGAIGYIGGTNSTYWDEDLWWGNGNYPIQHPNAQGDCPTAEQCGQGAYKGMFDGAYNTNGGMVVCGNLAVQETTSPRKIYYWEVYSLMGDPSLRVFWGTPQEITVTHAANAAAGATTLDVAAPAGAYVGVSANGDLLGAGTVPASGKAAITVKALPAGATVTVVVTGKNLKPYTGQITVAAKP